MSVVFGCVTVLGLYAVDSLSARPAPDQRPTPVPPRTAAATPALHIVAPAKGELRYLAIGGGATPEYTEVSLEQDIALVTQTLPGPGAVLFAGGSESASVRSLPSQTSDASLLRSLGELFDPRGARGSQYRRTTLQALPATLENVESSLVQALRAGSEPLFVYVASHGLQGDVPHDNHVELWGGEPLDVVHLDELLDDANRPVRFVIASCYSGGFAELAFSHVDPAQGPSRAARCGLFAGTWDRQTSGCDPNPDRRAQEGYSLHVLHALRGEDRDGKPLPRAQLDLDHDGQISLLEAHTRARIVSHSIDVPTTTSERYLREVERKLSIPNLKLLPEEAAVVQQLGARLSLPNKAAAEKRLKSLNARLDALEDELATADAKLERARRKLSAALLARWPVLDDPYHDDFAGVLAQHAGPIQQLLRDSALAREYKRASAEADALSDRASATDPDEAEVLRLVRAYETLALATALHARGGSALQHYQALLACERSVP